MIYAKNNLARFTVAFATSILLVALLASCRSGPTPAPEPIVGEQGVVVPQASSSDPIVDSSASGDDDDVASADEVASADDEESAGLERIQEESPMRILVGPQLPLIADGAEEIEELHAHGTILIESAEPVRRLALMADLEEGSDRTLEVLALSSGGALLEWRPIELTFEEERSVVGHVTWPDGVLRIELNGLDGADYLRVEIFENPDGAPEDDPEPAVAEPIELEPDAEDEDAPPSSEESP